MYAAATGRGPTAAPRRTGSLAPRRRRRDGVGRLRRGPRCPTGDRTWSARAFRGGGWPARSLRAPATTRKPTATTPAIFAQRPAATRSSLAAASPAVARAYASARLPSRARARARPSHARRAAVNAPRPVLGDGPADAFRPTPRVLVRRAQRRALVFDGRRARGDAFAKRRARRSPFSVGFLVVRAFKHLRITALDLGRQRAPSSCDGPRELPAAKPHHRERILADEGRAVP